MKIAVDIDDTLNIVDRVGMAGEYIKAHNLPFTVADTNSNYLVKVYNWEKADVLSFLRDGGVRIYADALLKEGAKEVLTALRAAGHEIIILTARMPEWFGDPETFSKEWLLKWELPYDRLVARVEEKGKYCKEHAINVLIDDNVDICRGALQSGVIPILAVGKHNEKYAAEFPYAGSTWHEIGEAIKKIEERI